MPTKWKAEYKINIKSAFKKVFPNPRIQDRLRPLLSDIAIKREIGNRVIDRIIERTEEGIDKNNKNFAGYSKSYKKSLQFKIYGKTSSVNLKLTGEMLASMVVVNSANDSIKITFVDEENNAKAHGHINGGKFRKNKSYPKRDFLGLPQDELNSIIKDVITESSQGLTAQILAGQIPVGIPLTVGFGSQTTQESNLITALAMGLGF